MTKAEQPTITQALKPCPFCGGEVYTEHHTEWFNSGTEFRGYSVTCDKCNMRFGTDNQLKGSHKDHTEGDFASDDAAIAAWNTRAPLAAQDVCPSCHGLNISCPNGCGRDPVTGELDGSTLKLAAQDGLVEALHTIVAMMGNVNHDKPGGPNDAVMRGGMLMDCKAIAQDALSAIKGDKS